MGRRRPVVRRRPGAERGARGRCWDGHDASWGRRPCPFPSDARDSRRPVPHPRGVMPSRDGGCVGRSWVDRACVRRAPGDLPQQTGPRPYHRAGAAAGAVARRRRRHLRDPGAPRERAALGLPARARRRAGVVGGAQGAAAWTRAPTGSPCTPRTIRWSTPGTRATSPPGSTAVGGCSIWDRGTYETEKWSDREVKVVLHGTRVDGRYVLFRTGGKNWMVHRMDPRPEGFEPLPELVRPMMAVLRETLPAGRRAVGVRDEVGRGARRGLRRRRTAHGRCPATTST